MAGTKDSLTLAWTASRLGNEFNNETAAVQDVLVQQSATAQDCFSHDVCSYFYNAAGGAK
ncbi:MAG: hypothetical protein L6R41_007580 [Letrouitia leprolyta]|nr:MAG: hypothetical protein L6R41_007580 [Letrouitia leprolyta]